MNKGIVSLLSTGLIGLASAGSTFAASIGISFLGDGDEGTDAYYLAPSDEAGVVPQTHWNNVDTTPTANVGVADAIVDHAGTPTGVQLEYVANDAWNSDGGSTTPNEKLMKGALKQGGGGSSMTLTFNNLASGSYDVYVYGNVNGGPVELEVSIGSSSITWSELADYTSFYELQDAGDPGNGGAGDYVKFLGVTPVEGSITITATYLSGGDGLGISGLQIVTTADFPPNDAAVAITGQPQSALAAPGGSATFAVEVAGPFPAFQWFKNGVAVPGATGSRYTTPPVTTSDDGALYKVTVSNNINSLTSQEVALVVREDPGTRVASIGVNFLGDGEEPEYGRLEATEEAGVVPQAHWNNIVTTGMDSGAFPPEGAFSDPLLDDSGGITIVQIHFKANDAWNSDGGDVSPNEKLMKGILKNYPGSSMVLTVTNLSLAFYDLYLYGNVNDGPVDMDVSVNAATNYWRAPAAFDDATGFIEATNLDPDTRGEGNYVKFMGVTPVGGTLRVTATRVEGSDGAAIAGLQVFGSVPFLTDREVELTAQLEGNEIVISWRSPQYQLQFRTDLSAGDWSDEPTPPEINGDQVTVRLAATGTAKFFRLVGE